MAYDSRVYRILIASPSDVEEERDIAVRTIQEWNDLYSYSRKVVLLPLRWETHTAPEYGTRPQEVINRAIVDQCDLLVGIFWTRIGSPTGVAESGTLEEIERVGKAEKPIMLYFSRVEIDPDRIDVEQIEKLKVFREKTYPKALVERYRKIIEFRDKFAKQLELKIRDLQRSDASGELPLSLKFLSSGAEELVAGPIKCISQQLNITNIEIIPADARDTVAASIKAATKRAASFPLALGIENISASGVRNLFVQITITADTSAVEITDGSRDALLTSQRVSSLWSNLFRTTSVYAETLDKFSDSLSEKLSRFDADGLQKTEAGWTLSFEWEALQPQRIRLIKPVLRVYSASPGSLSIKAKIFADSFPEPLSLESSLSIEVNKKDVSLSDVLPKWQEIIAEPKAGATENLGLLSMIDLKGDPN